MAPEKDLAPDRVRRAVLLILFFVLQVEDEEEEVVADDTVPVFRHDSRDSSRGCYFQDGVRKVGKAHFC